MHGWCKHYTALLSPETGPIETCGAGVNYRAHVGGVAPGWVSKLPCAGDRATAIPCEKREFPSAEERQKESAEMQGMINRSMKAIAAVGKDVETKGEPYGECPCPNCGGTLRYSIARNKHSRGKCSTAGCAEWLS